MMPTPTIHAVAAATASDDHPATHGCTILRQRAMIALALASRPTLLLCDEPTTALDVTTQAQILALLRKLGDELGVSLIYVSHDLSVVAQICSRLAVMYAGRIVETGPTVAVFGAPEHPYTLGLLHSMPDPSDVRGRLVPIPGAPPSLVHPPDGCRFHPRCPFVQPDCSMGRFGLLPIGADRTTACIHHDHLVEAPEPVVSDG